MAQDDHPCPSDSLGSPIRLFKSIVEGRVSALPREKFSHSMCVFVNQCLSQSPDKRPHPRALVEHPFIASYNDGNTTVVAEYVKQKILTGFK